MKTFAQFNFYLTEHYRKLKKGKYEKTFEVIFIIL